MLFILIHGARIKRKTCEVVSDLRQLFVLHVVRVRAHAFPGTLPYVALRDTFVFCAWKTILVGPRF